VEQTIKTGEASVAVLEIAADGDNFRFVEVFGYPLINRSSGQLEGAIEYMRDITERKRTEKE
jgi:signal transduction histidine kinase